MVAYVKQLCLTPEEYLNSERKADTKHEYENGVVLAMAEASWEHNIINANLGRYLGNALFGSPCITVTQDVRVHVADCERYYYPDVTVVCGPPRFQDSHQDTLLNPVLIVEVMSESTEDNDWGEKRRCYQTLLSLNTYLLVAQDRPQVEVYRKQANHWIHTVTEGLEAALNLETLSITVSLADIYTNVTFLPTAERDEEIQENL